MEFSNPAMTLEEVCVLWLRERDQPKAAPLAGGSLKSAATLMTLYLQYRAERTTSMRPPSPGGDQLEMSGDVSVSPTFVRSTFSLLRQWMSTAIAAAPPPSSSSSSSSPALPAASTDGAFGFAADLTRQSYALTDTSMPEEAVLCAIEALIVLHGKTNNGHYAAAPRPASPNMPPAVPPLIFEASGSGGGTSGPFSAVAQAFLEALLVYPTLQRPTCRAFSTLLCHQPQLLPVFLQASLKGRAPPLYGPDDGVTAEEACTSSKCSWQRMRPLSPVAVAAPWSGGDGWRITRFTAGCFGSARSCRTEISDEGEDGLGMLRPLTARSRRHTTTTSDHRGVLGGVLGGLLGGGKEAAAQAEPPSAVDAIREPSDAWRTYAYFYALVSNCASSMERWMDPTNIEARLLFLALLHQPSSLDGLRDLALQLSQALAYSPITCLMPPHDHQLPWVSSRDAQVYAAAPRYSAAIAPGHLSLLPDLLEELVTHFQILRLEEREALLQLLLPWLRALAVACADENGESLGTTVPLSDGGEQQPQRPTTPSARRGNARQMMSQVLKLLLSLSRLTKLQPGAASSGTAQSAHLAFLVEAAWAAVVSEASTPLLVPSLVELLLQSHVTAAAAQPVDVGEMELCSRVLLLVCRTPCVPQILSHLLSHLRHYDEQHCPPSDDAASWLVWRMRMPAARQPLSAVELSVIPMLAQLPYEQHNQLPPHLPLLLHTLCVCFAPEARSALQTRQTRHEPLVRPLAPTASSLKPRATRRSLQGSTSRRVAYSFAAPCVRTAARPRRRQTARRAPEPIERRPSVRLAAFGIALGCSRDRSRSIPYIATRLCAA